MRPLEDRLPLRERCKLAEAFLGPQPYIMALLKEIWWAILNRPSPYDYLSRVTVAKERLDGVTPEHRGATKIVLQEILINLAPDPQGLAVAGNNTYGLPSVTEVRDVAGLKDRTVAKRSPQAVELRYAILTRAFVLYMHTCLGIFIKELEEDADDGLYQLTHSQFIEKTTKPLSCITAARQALYPDFPEASLFSVKRSVLAMERTLEEQGRSDDVAQLRAELSEAERMVHAILTEIIALAQQKIQKLNRDLNSYLQKITPLRTLCQHLEGHLAEEEKKAINEGFDEYAERVKERFALNAFLTPETLEDIRDGYALYRDGDLSPPAKSEEGEEGQGEDAASADAQEEGREG